MARIRTVKPEFWSDYRLAKDLSRDQRLFYIGLWNQADDEGRFLAHPRRLLGEIFPYEDDLHAQFIEDSLRLLAETGRLVLYEVDGEPYGQLTKFAEHQRINRPTPSKIPAPPTVFEPQPDVNDPSVNAHGGFSEPSSPEGNREQGKEPERKSSSPASAHASTRASAPPARTAPAHGAHAPPTGAHTPPKECAELRQYLNGHGDVLDRMAVSAPHGPVWQHGIWGLYKPGGTSERTWAGVAEPDRPAILAEAIERFAGEGKPYNARLFHRFLEQVIDERNADRRPDDARTRPRGGHGAVRGAARAVSTESTGYEHLG